MASGPAGASTDGERRPPPQASANDATMTIEVRCKGNERLRGDAVWRESSSKDRENGKPRQRFETASKPLMRAPEYSMGLCCAASFLRRRPRFGAGVRLGSHAA